MFWNFINHSKTLNSLQATIDLYITGDRTISNQKISLKSKTNPGKISSPDRV